MSLTLRGAAALVRPDGNAYERDEALLAYQRDLLAPYGIEVDEDLMKQSRNIGFRELAEELMDRCPSPFGTPDLLILAYGLPDRYPLKTVTTRLNALFGGGSRSFAVSENGLRAPFTALRIADAYARSGKAASLALFVCEQTTLPYRDPLVHDTPLLDSAVLLYFDTGTDTGYRLIASRAAGSDVPLGELLAGQRPALPPGPALLVAGPWPTDDQLGGLDLPVHRCQPGGYCTSVWLDLVRHHEEWATQYASLVLCDTDPRTGRSQVAVLSNADVPEIRKARL
ncbi:hypothetical protein [Micromonospora endophytica]|uniref:Uncharacterized protein n=1 Tax=Micromonospora endophytica TaxID=515350 RepID=A0A2W2DLF3_9ACTN|nr:hypothetical protein [Micromonospora endophytica]PZG00558.1 hypothetical protein C1I93_02250 [Micromonospora endophytica]RIW45881.1 hypothetical protein D3H59_14025 [Micromonospora endophytica]BCJ61921.1 hypothetical protein Jiend_53430 [Micromonospora endophytica]